MKSDDVDISKFQSIDQLSSFIDTLPAQVFHIG